MRLKEDDEVVNVYQTNGMGHIFLVTQYGYGLLFSEEEIGEVGVRAAGVKGIHLKDGDYVVSGQQATDENIILVTKRGAVKKSLGQRSNHLLVRNEDNFSLKK